MFLLKFNVDDQFYLCKITSYRNFKQFRLKIDQNGNISLSVPHGTQISAIKDFLFKETNWIKKHLKQQNTRRSRFFFLGNELEIIHEDNASHRIHKVELIEDKLVISSPKGSKSSPIIIFNNWLRLKAKNYIPLRTEFLALENGFKYNKITIRGQKTRWGSCSRRGNLSFNFMLMQFPESVIDYVLVHELCHLKEMNHSEKFWSLVQTIIPNYKELRGKLKGVIN